MLSISETVQEKTGEGVNVLRSSRWLMIMVSIGQSKKGELGQIGEERSERSELPRQTWYSHSGITWFTKADSWIYSHKLATHLTLQVLTKTFLIVS